MSCWLCSDIGFGEECQTSKVQTLGSNINFNVCNMVVAVSWFILFCFGAFLIPGSEIHAHFYSVLVTKLDIAEQQNMSKYYLSARSDHFHVIVQKTNKTKKLISDLLCKFFSDLLMSLKCFSIRINSCLITDCYVWMSSILHCTYIVYAFQHLVSPCDLLLCLSVHYRNREERRDPSVTTVSSMTRSLNHQFQGSIN